MNFIHLWPLYAAAGAIAIPLAVHWLTRPRPKRYPLSTLRFVREAVEQRKARHRLRDFLILAARTAAILLLAAAMARPLWSDRPLVDAESPGDTARVVLVDTSQSMAAISQGTAAYERARAKAADYLAFRPGLHVNLLLAGAEPHRLFDGLSTNFQAMHDELAGSGPLPQRLNLATALRRAGEMLAASAASVRRELVVVSDFQRTSWESADFSAIPQDTRIELESVAPAEPPANLAVLRVSAPEQIVQGRPGRIEVEVGNYSPASRKLRVALEIEGTDSEADAAAYQLAGICEANQSITLSQEVTFARPGWRAGHARLLDNDDALKDDDVRRFALEVRPAPRYALVSREIASRTDNSSFYLERALAPFAARQAESHRPAEETLLARFDPGQIDDQAVAASDLIVLDHPGKLSDQALRRLWGLVERGRGILYFAAEAVDALNLKQLVSDSGGGLQLPVEFMPASASRPRRDLFLSDVRRDESPFSVFGDTLKKTISPLRFSGGLASRRLEAAPPDELLASFNDRSAALVLSQTSAGSMAVFNADLGDSNLIGSSAFVPMLTELVDRLTNRNDRVAPQYCGEPLAIYLPPQAGLAAELSLDRRDSTAGSAVATAGAESTAISPAAGLATVGKLTDEGAGVMWRAAAVGSPGVYEARRQGEPVFMFASEIPAEESDLRPLDPSVLKTRLAGGRNVDFRTADAAGHSADDAWTWLAVACVGCLLSELVFLRIFRV
ncbi:MAG TPA: BatA domain-containing protein [Pirellulales bacterium]|jgi:hypothetical protein|nr:BatA domain-containing protein [Pirellulales bacterium]